MTQPLPAGHAKDDDWAQRLRAGRERLRQLLRRALNPFARAHTALMRVLDQISVPALAVWTVVDPVVDILRFTRVASLSVLAGFLVLVMTSQGREVTLSLAEPIADIQGGKWLGWVVWLVLVQLAVIWWAFSCTLMARFNLERAKEFRIEQGRPAVWAGRLVDRTWPPLLLLACFFVYAMGIFTAAIKLKEITWPLLGLLTVNMALVATAVWLLWKGAAHRVQQKKTSGNMRKAITGRMPEWESFTVITALAVFVVLLVLFSCFPAWGQWLGSPFILFCFLAIVTSIFGALSKYCHRSRFPILTLILAWPFVVSLSPWNDNHEVRSLSAPKELPPSRSSISDALARWKTSLGPDDCRTGTDPRSRRLILVATAGGGLRAAYWTAAILGSLQDSAPQFRKCLFAISGVSGGSLGAVLFTSALSETLPIDKPACLDNKRTGLACRMDQALSRDFLGPTIGATLFPDLVQRFLPWRVFPDRAEALERAWEAGFDREGGTPLESDFLALWSPTRPNLPHLLLNGTDSETGARIVTSDLDLTLQFPETLDYFDISHASIRLSTAALNSGRFTYVSPAGTILYPPKLPASTNTGLIQARVIDGGYFENYGAQTGLDLLKSINAIKRAQPDFYGDIEPAVIQISSDPGLTEKSEPDLTQCERAMGHTTPRGEGAGWFERMLGRFASEARAPIDGMLMVRESRGLFAAKQLACAVGDGGHGERYVQFRMKPRPWPDGSWAPGKADERPPLGWLLTSRARNQMTEQLDNDCGTLGEFNKALAWLGVPAHSGGKDVRPWGDEKCEQNQVARGEQ